MESEILQSSFSVCKWGSQVFSPLRAGGGSLISLNRLLACFHIGHSTSLAALKA